MEKHVKHNEGMNFSIKFICAVTIYKQVNS